MRLHTIEHNMNMNSNTRSESHQIVCEFRLQRLTLNITSTNASAGLWVNLMAFIAISSMLLHTLSRSLALSLYRSSFTAAIPSLWSSSETLLSTSCSSRYLEKRDNLIEIDFYRLCDACMPITSAPLKQWGKTRWYRTISIMHHISKCGFLATGCSSCGVAVGAVVCCSFKSAGLCS